MRTITTRLTASTIALLAGIAVAQAQTTPAADPNHPETQAPGPKAGKPMTPPPGRQAGMGMDMSKMMGGDMEQMMPMMRMMQSMRMMDGMMPRDGGGMAMMPGQHIEGRIAFLKAELGITDAQLPQWNAFANAMREGAKSMQASMTANMGSGMPATAPARSDAMIAMMTARLETLKKTSDAGKALYAVLTDAQKKSADELMTSAGMGMGGRG
jgi:LTXXQ motif family protein